MTAPRDQVEQLRKQAASLPKGPVQIALLEEATQLADSMNDVELAYAVRNDLIDSATFSARPDLALIAFSWSLAQYDRDPDRFNLREILWQYKWVIWNACSFPQISRSRLEDLLADMERRYRAAGSTLHAVAGVRRHLQIQFGERKSAQAAHALFRKCCRDSLSDCAACVATDNCEYYSHQQQWGRAVQAVQPVLKSQLTCAEEPHRSLSRVLRPLIYLGRVDEAKSHQIHGYRLVSGANHFVREHAEHLQFLVLIGELAQAKRVLERHLSGALECVMSDERFHFLLAARFWCARVASQGSKPPKIRLPTGFAVANPGVAPDVSVLGEWFTSQAIEIARQFDTRNGTNSYRQQIDELSELLRLAADGETATG